MVSTVNRYQSKETPFGNIEVHIDSELEEETNKAEKHRKDLKNKYLHSSYKQKMPRGNTVIEIFSHSVTTLFMFESLKNVVQRR